MGRKISDNKGQFTGKMPTGAENQRIAGSTLFADGRQAITTVAISSSLTSKKPAELEEDATEEGISAHQDQGISDSVDMGGDEPLLLAQADIARVSGSGTGAAAAQSSSAYSAGPPPWLWVAGGLGALAAGGAIIAASSGSDSDAVSPPAPPSPPVNKAPFITSNGGGATAAVSVAENQTAVTTVTATDGDLGDTKTYSISGGADAGKFAINASTGVLTFLSAPNFESPIDAGANNVYDVQVTVTDGGALTDVQNIAVTVTDVNEAPSLALTNQVPTLAENSAIGAGIKVADITVTDDALGTETLSLSGTDVGSFSIVGNALYYTGTSPNFEARSAYNVTVNVDDATLGATPDASQNFTLNITNVAEPVSVVVDNQVGHTTSAMWIDTNSDGVLDPTETTLALIGQSAPDSATMDDLGATSSEAVSLSGDSVTIHYNDLPSIDWAPSLAGFGVDDMIEIDLVAMRFGGEDGVSKFPVYEVVKATPKSTAQGSGVHVNSAWNQAAVFTTTQDSDALFFGRLFLGQVSSYVTGGLTSSEGIIAVQSVQAVQFNFLQVDFVATL